MKALIITSLLFFSSFVFSQNLSILKIKILDSNSHRAIAYKEAILYNGSIELNSSFIDEEGKCTFIINDTTFTNSDSIHFCIKIDDFSLSNSYIYINNLKLFENNKIGNFSIKITDFFYLTTEEYTEYCKKNNLIPRKKKL